MEKTFDTKFGEISLRGAMIDVDGTNLADGVEIKLDDKLIGEAVGITFGQVEDMTIEEVEEFVEEHCDF
ncbi:MAG: hypothetical protein AABY15_06815 [Nanoarchaeota archaeon]